MSKPEVRISVFSDYICPFCYIGSRRLMRLEDEFALKVDWCGLEIHPKTPATGMPVSELGYAPERWRGLMANLRRLAAAEQLELRERDFTTNSRQALLLAEAAKQAGRMVFYRLHEALFDGFFRRGLNIGERAVLCNLAADAGMPQDLTSAAWTEPVYQRRLDLNLQRAAQLGVTGVPTYVLGGRLLSGAVDETTLREMARSHLATG